MRKLLVGILGVSLLVAPSMAASAKKIKLEVWSNGWSPISVIQQAFRGFEKANPNVTVSVVPMGSQWDMYPKLMLQVAAGAAPDLITVVTPIAELSDRNFLMPLNSYLKTSKVVKESDYNKAILDVFRTSGQLYALPAIDAGAWLGLCYNKTLFAESGLDPDAPPRNLDQLRVAHKKLTRVENKRLVRIGFDPLLSMGGAYFPEMWCPIFNVPYQDKTKGRVNFDSPEMAALMEYIRQFREEFDVKAYNDFRTKAGWGWGTSLAKGFDAMEMNGAWTPGTAKRYNPKANLGFTWFPNTKGDKMMVVGGWGLAIPKGAKHPELSWKLAEYVTQKASAQIMFDNFGFMNGNQRVIKDLDLSKSPDSRWFLEAVEQADRVVPAPDIPMWIDIKSVLNNAAWKIVQKQSDIRPALKEAQNQIEIILTKYNKQVTKYKKK